MIKSQVNCYHLSMTKPHSIRMILRLWFRRNWILYLMHDNIHAFIFIDLLILLPSRFRLPECKTIQIKWNCAAEVVKCLSIWNMLRSNIVRILLKADGSKHHHREDFNIIAMNPSTSFIWTRNLLTDYTQFMPKTIPVPLMIKHR